MSTPPCRPYRDLPPLAGLGPFAAAARPGLSVEHCVQRLKRFHYALRRLHGIFTATRLAPASQRGELSSGARWWKETPPRLRQG